MKKQYLIKCGKCVFVWLLIVVAILKVVDMHTDGMLVREAGYVISPQDAIGYRMEVYASSDVPGMPVLLMPTVDGASQIFLLKYVQDDEYAIIYGEKQMSIAVASDRTTVVVQDYDEQNDYNRWHVKRIGNSQNFTFTNVATNTSLYYEYSDTFKARQLFVKEYDEKDTTFGFELMK